CEDDLAEKRRSNDVLRKAIETYQEVAGMPDVPADLLKLSLKRRSERQQFLGHMRGSLLTLQRLVQLFPEDTSLKNDLGVGYLLLGDNDSAKKVYEESQRHEDANSNKTSSRTRPERAAAEEQEKTNKAAERVLNVTPNDGFAKVHYGFILKAQNKIAESIPYLKAYKWYELGHKRGHFASVWQRSLYNVHGLKAQPWWTAKETGYTELVKSLERNWKVIRDEGLAVMDKAQGLFLPEDENLREKGDWSQFTLWQQVNPTSHALPGDAQLVGVPWIGYWLVPTDRKALHKEDISSTIKDQKIIHFSKDLKGDLLCNLKGLDRDPRVETAVKVQWNDSLISNKLLKTCDKKVNIAILFSRSIDSMLMFLVRFFMTQERTVSATFNNKRENRKIIVKLLLKNLLKTLLLPLLIIKYSVMHPGTHVWPHTGPTNCRLRMHLGLVIPKEGCKIRCANETKGGQVQDWHASQPPAHLTLSTALLLLLFSCAAAASAPTCTCPLRHACSTAGVHHYRNGRRGGHAQVGAPELGQGLNGRCHEDARTARTNRQDRPMKEQQQQQQREKKQPRGTWEEGKVLIFDDSFEHEVWQEATSFRLIFIVDVWHPELTPQQRHSLPAI
ncbi:Aspartyl/asparaginyl beta-hydroxylase, partial [Galemys pyrenaicus]